MPTQRNKPPVIGGQVTEELFAYVQAFAKAKGTTVSRVVAQVLTDWHEGKTEVSAIDAAAHKAAKEAIAAAAKAAPTDSPPRTPLIAVHAGKLGKASKGERRRTG